VIRQVEEFAARLAVEVNPVRAVPKLRAPRADEFPVRVEDDHGVRNLAPLADRAAQANESLGALREPMGIPESDVVRQLRPVVLALVLERAFAEDEVGGARRADEGRHAGGEGRAQGGSEEAAPREG